MKPEEGKRDLTINFLKKGKCFYVLYDKNMVQYEDISRENKLQEKERIKRGTTCKICNKPIIEENNKYNCEECNNPFHKSCLKSYSLDLGAADLLSDGESFKCFSCQGPIDFINIMSKREYDIYITSTKMQMSKDKRNKYIHEYINIRPSIVYEPIPKGQKPGSFKEEKHHCVLCGKDFELHNFIENLFFHHAHNNNCKGGYVHKKCLRKVLSIYFWRKYERYNGISILILTESEAQVLGKNWVCPLCNEKLTEKDLKMLVDPREWVRQIKMRDERDRVFRSRYNESRIITIYTESKGFT